MTVHRYHYADLISLTRLQTEDISQYPPLSHWENADLQFRHTRNLVGAQHSPRNRWNVFRSAQKPRPQVKSYATKGEKERDNGKE